MSRILLPYREDADYEFKNHYFYPESRLNDKLIQLNTELSKLDKKFITKIKDKCEVYDIGGSSGVSFFKFSKYINGIWNVLELKGVIEYYNSNNKEKNLMFYETSEGLKKLKKSKEIKILFSRDAIMYLRDPLELIKKLSKDVDIIYLIRVYSGKKTFKGIQENVGPLTIINRDDLVNILKKDFDLYFDYEDDLHFKINKCGEEILPSFNLLAIRKK